MLRAIIQHETQNGKLGVGLTHNNLCGIRRNGKFVRYATREESWDDCMNVYMKYYKNLSIYQMSRKWTATQSKEWETNVRYFYEKFTSE